MAYGKYGSVSYTNLLYLTACWAIVYLKAVDSRDSINIAPPELHEDALCEAALSDSPDEECMEKSLLRKLDIRMSILVLIYILNFVDRTNVAAARLKGFEEDLHLKGHQFYDILSVVWVGYLFMQVPSNMLLNRIGKPSVYLPGCMAIWGAITILKGTATTYTSALLAQLFVGFAEAAFLPGALLLLSQWYRRRELGKRTALLMCSVMISNAFGSLMASVVLDAMDGVLGYAAWRWLFFVEGALTVAVAVSAIFVLPDLPSSPSRWLTAQEHTLVQLRMDEDGLADEESADSATSQVSGLMLALSDWKVWWLCFAVTCMNVSLSFIAFFPTLGAIMGFNPTVTLLLCAPPWVFATFVGFKWSRRSDARGERFWHVTVPLLWGVIGFLIAILTSNMVIYYISLFLMAQSFIGPIVVCAWVSNSLPRPISKRAAALGLVNTFSSVGALIGSYCVWPTAWGPSYTQSYAICAIGYMLSIAMFWVFREHLKGLNQELEEEDMKLNRAKGFRYLV